MIFILNYKKYLVDEELKFEGINNSVLDAVYQNVSVSLSGTEYSKHKVRVSKYNKRKPSTRINVDRPFVFYLLDNAYGSLAVGRVTKLNEVTFTEVPKPSSESPLLSSSVSPEPEVPLASTTPAADLSSSTAASSNAIS